MILPPPFAAGAPRDPGPSPYLDAMPSISPRACPERPLILRNRPWRGLLTLVLPLGLAGCLSEVPFYERRAFADPVMDLGSDPAQVHFLAKTLYSTEGSIGGVGTSGGGGCGCY
jgi:hypothetical protein